MAFRWAIGLIGALAILLALFIVGMRVLLFQVPERRAELQDWVNAATGFDLRMKKLSARWSSGGPQIYATDVEVYAPYGGPRLARAKAVSIAADFKRMLKDRELLTGHIRLIGPQVRLVRTEHGLRLEGNPQFPKRPSDQLDSNALPSGTLEIVDGAVTVLDAGAQELLRLQGVHVKLQRNGETLTADGDLHLPASFGGTLEFSGSAVGWLGEPETLSWKFKLAGSQLRLERWNEFLSERWRGLNPRGEVSSLDLALTGNGFHAPQVKLAASFSGLGFDPVDRLPGLSGLAGEVMASEHSGQAILNAVELKLDMPHRFREPLRGQVVGALNWERLGTAAQASGWRLASNSFQVSSPHGRASGDVELTIPTDGSSRVLKLHAHFQDAVLKESWRYFPIDRIRNPKTLAWLDRAFLSGRATSGEIFFEGPTQRFPFRNGEGEFRVTGLVEQVNLHYAEGWPDLNKLAAEVEFRNQGMSAKLHSGFLHGMRLVAGSSAKIADFKLAELSVNGRTIGDLSSALAYLRASPIGAKLGKQFMSLRGFGPLGAQVELWLPIKERHKHQFTVAAELGGGSGRDRLLVQDTQHELRDLHGTLRVSGKQLTAKALRATYLGGPVVIDLKPRSDLRSGRVENVVHVQGQTSAAALAQALKVPEKVVLTGTVPWRAIVRVASGGQSPAAHRLSVRIDSDLLGTGIGLPAPLTKAASESRPLRIELEWPQADAMQVQAVYSGLLQTDLVLSRKISSAPPAREPAPEFGAHLKTAQPSAAWRLARGAIRLGRSDSGSIPAAGLSIEGTVDVLDLPGWLGLRSAATGERRISNLLRSIDLSIRDLRLYGFRLPQVSASLVAGAQAWSVRIDGPRARGMMIVPFDMRGADPVRIEMTRLDLGEPIQSAGSGAGSGADPTRWPAVKATVGDFAAWNRKFGLLQVELVPIPNGLSLRSLSSRASSFHLEGSGAWIAQEKGQEGKLALRVESSDVLHTLQSLGYGASLTGQRGLAQLNLSWSGAPDGALLSRLSGDVSVEVDKGQLLGVQPGAGRVFGLMSVATLRRRLALDFSDLTDKGLAFDEIRGDFTVKQGNAYTSNLLLRGPAAEIGVVGRTGLRARDYDQTAVVTGSLGQSLPVAGALAGGPAVGAALLLFSQIFKQPLKGIARGYYRITGPWEDPTVERVEADEVKKAIESARMSAQSGAI